MLRRFGSSESLDRKRGLRLVAQEGAAASADMAPADAIHKSCTIIALQGM
jgi:hypothetical protein